MADVFSREKRSEVMSRIKGRDTEPERRVRSYLHRAGFRFRLHAAELSGKPDLVLPRYGAVVFVHGCFWHGHEGCRLAVLPRTNAAFWRNKINATRVRDRKKRSELEALGWRVHEIWECDLSETRLALLASAIRLIRGRS